MRSIPASFRRVFLRLGRSRDGGSPSARFRRQAPDRPTDALVRAMARHRTANADSGSSRTQLIHPSPFRRRESSLSSSEGAQPPLRPLHLRHHNAARDLSRAAAPQLSGRGRSQRTANGRRQRRRRSSAIGPACHRRRTRAARNRGRPHDQLRTRYQSFAATAGGSGKRANAGALTDRRRGASPKTLRSCRATNTRPDPLRASRRWRLSEGSPKRRAPPRPSTIVSVQLDGKAVQEEQSAPVRDPIFRRA
jgi:hypothetical protein